MRIWVVPCRSVHAKRKMHIISELLVLLSWFGFPMTSVSFRMYSQSFFFEQNLAPSNKCRWCKSNMKAYLWSFTLTDFLHQAWPHLVISIQFHLYWCSLPRQILNHSPTNKPLHLSLFCFQSSTLYIFWLLKNKQVSTKSSWSKQHPSRYRKVFRNCLMKSAGKALLSGS